ncbi:MAG: hypothetical protein PHN82_00200 [bacterium]|nr:hypothetical protein [bacterium]
MQSVDFAALARFVRGHFPRLVPVTARLREPVVAATGLIYDFAATRERFESLPGADDAAACHIIYTGRLIATRDPLRGVHVRAAVYAFPSVISTAGIVEGPARPREYHIARTRYAALGLWEREEPTVRELFRGRFIDYGDPRMTEVLKGYTAQALFYRICGDPFCPRRNCRLYDAHRQEDLIRAQLVRGTFCAAHKKMLEKFRRL